VWIERRTHRHDVLAHLADQLAARDDGAAHHVAVARGVLRQAMQENVDVVGAVVMKAGKGIVEHRERAGAPRMRGQMFDVGNFGDGIGGTLEHHQAGGSVAQHPFYAAKVLDGQQGVSDAELRQKMLHDVASRTIRLDEGENVIAPLTQR